MNLSCGCWRYTADMVAKPITHPAYPMSLAFGEVFLTEGSPAMCAGSCGSLLTPLLLTDVSVHGEASSQSRLSLG